MSPAERRQQGAKPQESGQGKGPVREHPEGGQQDDGHDAGGVNSAPFESHSQNVPLRIIHGGRKHGPGADQPGKQTDRCSAHCSGNSHSAIHDAAPNAPLSIRIMTQKRHHAVKGCRALRSSMRWMYAERHGIQRIQRVGSRMQFIAGTPGLHSGCPGFKADLIVNCRPRGYKAPHLSDMRRRSCGTLGGRGQQHGPVAALYLLENSHG